ncbi:hypothetical protein JW758_02340 [Candidatus Peregrinibacteria bacterium]|nr:hypothetical protein [Candidatus Peregrinibacteria bacterium]
MGEIPDYNLYKTLDNGIVILNEEITEDNDSITFELKLDNEAGIEDLSELWDPNSQNHIILDKLIEKGWITADFITILHFKMDVLYDNAQYKFKFRFYKTDSALNKGPEDSN